jgi:hypothetical protein
MGRCWSVRTDTKQDLQMPSVSDRRGGGRCLRYRLFSEAIHKGSQEVPGTALFGDVLGPVKQPKSKVREDILLKPWGTLHGL